MDRRRRKSNKEGADPNPELGAVTNKLRTRRLTSKVYDKNIFTSLNKLELYADRAISVETTLNRHLNYDTDLLVPPPPPSLLDYISRAASAKLPPEGRLNRDERQVFARLKPREKNRREKSKNPKFRLDSTVKIEANACHTINKKGTEDQFNEDSTDKTDAFVKDRVDNENIIVTLGTYLKSDASGTQEEDGGETRNEDKELKLRNKTTKNPHKRKRDTKPYSAHEEMRELKNKLLPRTLYQRLNMSALVATGVAVEETLTSILMPLAQFYVDHCRSSGKHVSLDGVLTPGEALADALSSPNHSSVNMPWLPGTVPSTSKQLLDHLKKKGTLGKGIIDDEDIIFDNKNYVFGKSRARWAKSHGYSIREFKGLQKGYRVGPLLCPLCTEEACDEQESTSVNLERPGFDSI